MEFILGAKAQLKLDIICKIEAGRIDRSTGCKLLDVTGRSVP